MISSRHVATRFLSLPTKILRATTTSAVNHLIYQRRWRYLTGHRFSSMLDHSGDTYESEPHLNNMPKLRRRLSDDLFNLSRQGEEHVSYNAFQAVEVTNNSNKEVQQLQKEPLLENDAVVIPTWPELLEENIPLHSKETAELLFDGIAPYLAWSEMRRLKALLDKFHTDHNNGICLISKINESFKKDVPWIRPILSHFLVGRNVEPIMYCSQNKAITHSPHQEIQHERHNDSDVICKQSVEDVKVADEVWLDPLFPPNSNRLTWSRDVDILMRAQEKSSRRPPLWFKPVVELPATKNEGNDSTFKTKVTIIQDEVILQNRETALKIHRTKPEAIRWEEAEEIATLLADRLPRNKHEKLMALLAKWAPPKPEDPEAAVNSGITNSGKMRGLCIKYLETKLNHTLDCHVHLVSLDLAKYFYVYVPPSVIASASLGANSIAIMDVNGQALSSEEESTLGDTRLLKAWKEWNKLRSSVVKRLLDCQLVYSQPRASPFKPITTRNETTRTKHDVCHDIIPRWQLLRATVSVLNNTGGSTQTTDYINVKDRLRSFQRSHCVFDALILNEDLMKRVKDTYRSHENRVVFVKNLPIDITDDELQKIYGRCGPIESMQIFNKRPDLDSGKPPLKELLKRRQRNRRMFKREESSTPVYARILFRDEEGYNVATNDNLTIFGVVIRKYPCRTIMKNQMRSLFLENFPPGQFSMDIEYKISKALHPDIYVCLNVGYHDFTGIASCEIKFPSHEVASYAYDRLREIEDLGTDIHWMRTPSDAHMHWTREISYDYS